MAFGVRQRHRALFWRPRSKLLSSVWMARMVMRTRKRRSARRKTRRRSESLGVCLKMSNCSRCSGNRLSNSSKSVHMFLLLMSTLKAHTQARPDLPIQDITALLVSLTNLSLSCYPDRLEYVDQVLAFAQEKVKEFSDGYASNSLFARLMDTQRSTALTYMLLKHPPTSRPSLWLQ